MDEIVSLEKMVQKFVIENVEVVEKKTTLETKVENLEKENEVLVLKIKELERKINVVEDNSSVADTPNLDLNERQNLKNQIDDLISRIDYHIKS